MRVLRSIATVAALLAASALCVQPAFASAPGNDLIGGVTTASIGFSQVLDTTQATLDAHDAQLNASCGAPATDASVWYTINLAAYGAVVVAVSASDYSAGVLVGVGTPGAMDTVACGPGTVGFFATAGTTLLRPGHCRPGVRHRERRQPGHLVQHRAPAADGRHDPEPTRHRQCQDWHRDPARHLHEHRRRLHRHRWLRRTICRTDRHDPRIVRDL
jgi:hypothetical protein